MTRNPTTDRTVEAIRYRVFADRVQIGWYEPARDADAYDAFNATGKPLGRFTSEGAAAYAIRSGLLPRGGGSA